MSQYHNRVQMSTYKVVQESQLNVNIVIEEISGTNGFIGVLKSSQVSIAAHCT